MRGTIVITGASRGIGRATAMLAARSGFDVCVNYRRNSSAASEVVDAIKAEDGNAIAVQADVGDADDVRQLFDTAATGLGPVAALVNNAGIVAPQSPFAELDQARFEQLIRTNLVGVFLCCQEACRRMARSGGGNGGAIVNVSSVAARTGSPFEYTDYAATKGALDTLTNGLAREVAGEGIRVNLVRPGFIYTDMHADGGEPGRVDRLAKVIPMRRGGHPAEVARAILWLCSDEASYAVGARIDVTGGV